MASSAPDNWSPADNPYAIAVSEAQWWKESARLAVLRMRRNDDARFGWFSAQQIDARQLVFALRQLLSAEDLEQFALKELGIDQAVRDVLAKAREQFENALPGIKDMRDGLMHFEEWARGMGRGPQKKQRDDGALPRDVARHFWGFGYDPRAGTVSFGPYTIEIDVAERAAHELSQAIYMAAREVDAKNIAALRARTVDALARVGIPCDSPESKLLISPGADRRVWVSLKLQADATDDQRWDLARRVVAALVAAGLRLVSTIAEPGTDVAELLVRRDSLFVEAGPEAG